MKTLGLLVLSTLLGACGSSNSDDASGAGGTPGSPAPDAGTVVTYPLSGIPHQLALDDQRGLLWVVYGSDAGNGVDAIDTKTGSLAGSVSLPEAPTDIAIDSSNGTVVVSKDYTATWFQGVDGDHQQSISTQGQPTSTIAADSGTAYVVTRPATMSDSALLFLAPESGAPATTMTIGPMLYPYWIVVDPDAHVLRILSQKLPLSGFEIETIDPISQAITAVPFDGYPWAHAVVDGQIWVLSADGTSFTLKIPTKGDVALPSDLYPHSLSPFPGGAVVFGDGAEDQPVYCAVRKDSTVSELRAQPVGNGHVVTDATSIDASGTLFVLTRSGTEPDPYVSKVTLKL